MLVEKLEHLVGEIGSLQSKLVLIVGATKPGKTALLGSLAARLDAVPLNVGAVLGRQLAAIPIPQRHLRVDDVWRDVADRPPMADLLLVDNIELLFDRALRLDPIALLKRQAHAKRVVAVWPGELRDGRLRYAKNGHPEYRDYGQEGVITFQL